MQQNAAKCNKPTVPKLEKGGLSWYNKTNPQHKTIFVEMHMKRLRLFSSLKSKIIACIVGTAAVCSLWLSTQYYRNYNQQLLRNNEQLTQANIEFILRSIDDQLTAVEFYSSGILSNQSFYELLSSNVETPDSKLVLVSLQEELRMQMYRSIVQDYIERVLVQGENGAMIQWSATFGSLQDGRQVEQQPFFTQSVSSSRVDWVGLGDSIVSNNLYTKPIIPLLRPFFSDTGERRLGWLYIECSTDILQDVLQKYPVADGSEVSLFSDQGLYLAHSDPARIGQEVPQFAELSAALVGDSGSTEWNGQVLVYRRSEKTGWCIVQSTPMANLTVQQHTFFEFSGQILLVGAAFVLLVGWLLSANLTRPIQRLTAHLQKVQGGEFEADPALEGDDEIGRIGRTVNEMTLSIRQLLQENREKEKNKRQLEMKVLQSQINPHFLYNTLNSIKWMATIQNAPAIAEVTVSLSRLLRNVAAGTDQKVTLEEELSLLKEYIKIQKLRYGEKFEVFFDDELDQYGQLHIVKMTLQPLVENAIFHGIEPKDGPGNIYLSACTQQGALHIIVEDDGVGMQVTPGALPTTSDARKERFSSIGLRNIDQRLKLCYGSQYGLTLESEPGAYTRVIVTIPEE